MNFLCKGYQIPNQIDMGREDVPPSLEEVLILNAMQGDAIGLAAIYDVYAQRIHRYFYSRVENTGDAEDLTAQTFMSVIEALPRYQHRGQLTAWVFQIARSKVMDFFRRNNSRSQAYDRFKILSPDMPVVRRSIMSGWKKGIHLFY